MRILLCTVLLLGLSNTVFADPPALIATTSAPIVYQEANERSTVIGNLIQGDRVVKLEEKDRFYQINAFKGVLIGWVKKSDLSSPDQLPSLKKIAGKTSPILPDKKHLKYSQEHKKPHGGGYQGIQYCKQCHHASTPRSTPGGSKPLEVWSRSPHARAYRTLFSARAIEAGKKYGISAPHQAPECLRCHQTGYGAPSDFPKATTPTEGVGCESCHGPSSALHGSKTEWDIEQIKNRQKLCTKCHNSESPTFKGFDLERDSQAIAHWNHFEEVEGIRKGLADDRTHIPDEGGKTGSTTSSTTGSAEVGGLIIPEQLTLQYGSRGPVSFPHGKHARSLGVFCSSCHHNEPKKCSVCHTSASESSPSRQQIFHGSGLERDSCVSCHTKQGGRAPVGCSGGCHVSSDPKVEKPQGAGPEVISLRGDTPDVKAVSFPHRKHQGFSVIGGCETCHHKPEPKKCRSCHTPTFDVNVSQTFHDGSRACRKCHQDQKKNGMEAPVTCAGCHTGP